MTDDAAAYNLSAVRDLLLATFTDEELRRLVRYTSNPALSPLSHELGSGDDLATMVDKAITYCEKRGALPDLLAEVKQERVRQYTRFEPDLSIVPATPLAVHTSLDPAAVAAYLEIMGTRYRRAETRPYRQFSELRGTPARLSLLAEGGRPGVYVPLRFDLHPSRSTLGAGLPGEALAAGKALRQQVARDLSHTDVALVEVLATPGHLVFLGAAGCGKSTLLRLIATILAARDPALARAELALDPAPTPDPRYPIPVFIALRDFEHACQTDPDSYRRDVEGLLRFLDDHFQRWHPDPRIPPGFLGDVVRSGRAWLLLDALDEVADFDHRIAVRQVIEHLADAFPGNRLLVTARVAAYSGANTHLDERFHLATVRDLTREQWAPLVERLYAGLEADPGVAVERTRLLLARIDRAPALQEMVKTPLMVWTATLIHYAERELPEQRAELYNAYVDVLLGERLHAEESAEAAQPLHGRWSVDERRLYLSYAAWQVHEQSEGEGARHASDEHQTYERQAHVVVDERDLVRRILAPFMAEWMMLGGDDRQVRRQAEREAADFVGFMAERSGLLQAHAEGYSFGDHLTVQEFLAANYLADNVRGSGEWGRFLQAHAGRTWWREVFLLMAGYLLQWPQQLQRFLMNELGNLPGKEDGQGDSHVYGLAWAGQALLEIPPGRVSWHANARDELARRLIGVLGQNPPQTSVAARVDAGDVLGQLGDPRFSGPYLLPEFIPIPAGRFWMGSDEGEIERLVRETGEDWPKRELPRH